MDILKAISENNDMKDRTKLVMSNVKIIYLINFFISNFIIIYRKKNYFLQ